MCLLARTLIIVVTAGPVVACGTPAAQVDASISDADADADTACMDTLTMSHCVDTATAEPCLDFEATTRQLIELNDDTVVDAIVGLQGSDMYVLALRGPGFDMGSDRFQVQFELSVTRDGGYIGGVFGSPFFEEEGEEVVARQIFATVSGAADYEGDLLEASVEITDVAGDTFCGSASFIGGAIIGGIP